MKANDNQTLHDDHEGVWTFHGGIKLPGHKDLSTQTAINKLPACEHYTVPLNQHIGADGEILVAEGERVLKGQMLAKPRGIISAAVHSPVSGTVETIAEHTFPHPSGLAGLSITIKNDYKDEWTEHEIIGDDFINRSSHDLRNVVRDAGIVGLGGATFPAAVKQTEVGIETLILNGVECEPYISCDDMLMREHATEIVKGAEIVAHIINAEKCIIAIEDNKPEAIASMSQAAAESKLDNLIVQSVPTIYPSGGERQLIKVITGKEVPVDGLPADIHVLCHNVATSYAIYKAIYKGEPLISRVVTLTGHGINSPQNIEAAIGAPVKTCVEYCGGYKDDASTLIMGGPMMGLSLETDELPIIKATNCLLVTTSEDISLPTSTAHMPCIRCGKCVEVCPANLLPQQLYWYSASKDYDRAIEYNLFDCIECGCCSYVCPSQIPLVQYYRYAKSDIWEQERDRKKSDMARERHERRLERIEKQKREREEKLKKKREALAKNKGSRDKELDKKKELIAQALARVNEKKSTKHIKAQNVDNLTEEQQKQIAEVDKRRADMKKDKH